MDDGKGNLVPLNQDQYEKQKKKDPSKIFKSGEVVTIRGSRFRINKITNNKIILKLLPEKSHHEK